MGCGLPQLVANDNEHAASSIKSGAMYETGVPTHKATWRNGSAFGFDCRRHQKVAGSSPAVVIFSLIVEGTPFFLGAYEVAF